MSTATHDATGDTATFIANPDKGLLDHHRREMHASSLTDETIKAAAIYSERSYAMLQVEVGWTRKWPPKMGPAIVIPYLNPDGSPTGFKELKPDGPRNDGKGKPIKYEWRKGAPRLIYYPPGCADALAGNGRLILTEGAKKSLAGTQAGFVTLGLPGVWGFSVKGKANLPPGFEAINWKGRLVIIAFDSDVETNPKVKQAESRLAAILKRRGAIVKVARLPSGPNGEKVGLDDFLVANDAAALNTVFNRAQDPEIEQADQEKEPASNADPMEEARDFIDAQCRDSKGVLKLRFHQGEFFRHNGRKYQAWAEKDIRAPVIQFLDRNYIHLKTSVTSNVIDCLKSECNVFDTLERPVWLGDGDKGPNVLPVANGLLDIDAAVAGDPGALRPHTPEYFDTICLSYNYDPKATCPRWQDIVAENVGRDLELFHVIQEVLGYCLIRSTYEQRFVMLYGDGGGGKSTILAGMTATLGSENVSSVPLERFGDKYSLHGMLGKLANIAAEIGEVDKVAEGHLKSLTSGDPMTFERKYHQPFTAIPTARLIFSTNNLPRITDRSGGVWRRLLLIPFNQVVPPEKRIKGLDKEEWWKESGELPGMLNWALAGLKRLREQGGFTHSEACEAARNEYRQECNPAAIFLREQYREDSHSEVLKADVFAHYLAWCEAANYRPLTDGNFAKEVPRTFPMVKDSRVRRDGGRVRIWEGMAKGGGD